MKKKVLILSGIAVIVLSGLSNIALSISEDDQWNSYVLRWDEKLPLAKKKQLSKKAEPIVICSEKARPAKL